MMPENEYLTVSQLNTCIKDVLNMGFPGAVWVCGEIQGYNRNKDKNHVFFELCEKDPRSKEILARAGLVIFSGRKNHIEDVLRGSENAFQLKDDIEVKFLCRVDFYPPHGAVRLIVESIDPVYTLGKIAQEKQRLIALLKKNGTLDKNKLVALPLVPLRIGLITAYDSAAYNDFLSELRESRYGFKVFCRSTLMQGKSAYLDVCRAVDDLSRPRAVDVIVITRGGGSIAELSCFDHQDIAERIAACPLPVLSGIGHEINITMTDLAAHTYQKTPTAIAQFLVQRVADFLAGIEQKGESIISSAGGTIAAERKRLKNHALKLHSGTMHFLKDHHQELTRLQELIRYIPVKYLEELQLRVDGLKVNLLKGSEARFKGEHVRLKNFQRLIELADPRGTLKRGFSITRLKGGGLVRHAADVQSNDQIVTQLADGVLESVVRLSAPDVQSKEEAR